MKSTPTIIVRLIHIDGPLKGKEQEFYESVISIGRDSSCHVNFPKDLTVISRKHAEIVREGNRFKVIDHSTNGTIINGKKVKEAFLKTGDVLIIGEGGPKVSFLTETKEGQGEIDNPPSPEIPKQTVTASVKRPVSPAQQKEPLITPTRESAGAEVKFEPSPPGDISVERVQVPLAILFGPTLQSFYELPVTIGKNPDCDFTLDNPAILDHHAQIFFSQDRYWVKDLTGQNLVSINQQPVSLQVPLIPDSVLSLSPSGPVFQFRGGGQLVEIEAGGFEKPLDAPYMEEEKVSPIKPAKKGTKKGLLFFGVVIIIVACILIGLHFVFGKEIWSELYKTFILRPIEELGIIFRKFF